MDNYLKSVKKLFLYYKKIGEEAMQQLSEEELFWQYNEESNSIAIIVRHIAGNMLSRFTDFLISDGEKPWRNRDEEFRNGFKSKEELFTKWEEGWSCLFNAVDTLTENDLSAVIFIRNEKHTVTEALNRQLAHYPYHVGQIIFIAKMAKNADWKTLSIARNKSADFNNKMFASNEENKI